VICNLLEWEGELVGGLWFAWEMGWRVGLWWHMIKQMGDGIMKFNETWWIKGHGTFGAHEEGGLLRAYVPFFKDCLQL